jgi:MFS family permease
MRDGAKPLISAEDLDSSKGLSERGSLSPVNGSLQNKFDDDEAWGYEPPKASVWLIYFVSLSMSVEYALLMPTLNDYVDFMGGTTAFYGIVLSAFSITRTTFFVVFGLWSDKRDMKEPFMFAFAIVILGDLLYAFADATCDNAWSSPKCCWADGDGLPHALPLCSSPHQSYTFKNARCENITRVFDGLTHVDAIESKCSTADGVSKSAGLVMIMVGRLIAGIGGANTTLTQAYFARAAAPEKRMKFLALANGFALFGLLLGPAFNVLFVKFNLHLGHFRLYENTAPGYVMAIVNLASLVSFWLWFENPPKDKEKLVMNKAFYGKVWTILWRKGGWYCLMLNFIMGFEITGLETAITPITKSWGWGSIANSIFFAGIAVVALISIVSTIILDKRPWCSGRLLILGAFVCIGLSFIAAFAVCGPPSFPKWGLFLFAVLFVYGVMLMNAPNTAIYSILIGDEGKGVFMGYAQITLGLSRICGPLAAAITMKSGASPHWFLFGALSLPFIAGPLFLPFTWHQLDVSKKAVLEEDALISNQWTHGEPIVTGDAFGLGGGVAFRSTSVAKETPERA